MEMDQDTLENGKHSVSVASLLCLYSRCKQQGVV